MYISHCLDIEFGQYTYFYMFYQLSRKTCFVVQMGLKLLWIYVSECFIIKFQRFAHFLLTFTRFCKVQEKTTMWVRKTTCFDSRCTFHNIWTSNLRNLHVLLTFEKNCSVVQNGAKTSADLSFTAFYRQVLTFSTLTTDFYTCLQSSRENQNGSVK